MLFFAFICDTKCFKIVKYTLYIYIYEMKCFNEQKEVNLKVLKCQVLGAGEQFEVVRFPGIRLAARTSQELSARGCYGFLLVVLDEITCVGRFHWY